ncbi:MAG: flagellar motor switch protein FliN [Actinobacteria bacterium 13_1_20CM_3_71_11]|nr:MAG: flagellar motor switch protein FliN [Actinobacteria bacterium 13_1_20CM_3_71_11]
MTATQVDEQLRLATQAAEAALAVLPSSSPLQVGTPLPGVPDTVPPGQAVSARFGGTATGEVAVLVGQDLADALQNSPLGELDLTKAVRPALDAAAGVFGPVVVDPGQVLEPAVALGSLAAKGELVVVPLLDGEEVRAAVALVLTPWPGTGGATAYGLPAIDELAVPGTAAPASPSRGLDLLHDVEMEVSAELGRTRMSVRELLSLSPGAVVDLDRAAGSPADLLVNGRLIARGEVVVIDENFGLRITEIVVPGAERI